MRKKQLIEKENINFNGHTIKLLRKRIKNINLTVRTDRSVRLSVPFKLSEKEIYKFLKEKEDWINRSKEKFKNVIQEKDKEYITGEIIEYLGDEYILNIIEIKKDFNKKINESRIIDNKCNILKEKIEINGEYLDIFVLEKDNNREYIKNLIYKWYRNNLIYIVTDLTKVWAKKIGVSFNEIKIRKLKRTWGSCNTNKKIITYSLKLAKKSKDLIEYVVVHELCHLIYDNHGKEFKDLMTKLMPDWKKRKKILNNMKGF